MLRMNSKVESTKLVFILFMIGYATILSGQHVVRGIILEKRNKEPLIGAAIFEKGTTSGMITDIDGRFELSVRSPEAILVIQYVGFARKEVKIKGNNELNILLNESCIKCWFDYQEINVSIHSGVLKTPMGMKFDISSPVLFNEPLLRFSGRLQTNFNENYYWNLGASLNHLFSSCNFDADVAVQFNRFEIKGLPQLYDLSAFIKFNGRNRISPIVGVKRFSYSVNDAELFSNRMLGGLGLTSFIRMPVFFEINTLVFFNTERVNYMIQANSYYREVNIFLDFYKFGPITELSIGLGYGFNYLFKKQRDEYHKLKGY